MQHFCVAMTVVAVTACPGVAAVIFDDGKTHVVDEPIEYNDVIITNQSTVIQRAPIKGASWDEDLPDRAVISVADASSLILEGGRIDLDEADLRLRRAPAIHAVRGSKIAIDAGRILASGIVVMDSEIQHSGGETIALFIDGGGDDGIFAMNSKVVFSGGDLKIESFSATGIELNSSTGEVSGGSIHTVADGATGVSIEDGGSLTFSGGTITAEGNLLGVAGVRVDALSEFIMTGGHLTAEGTSPDAAITTAGRVKISGGQITTLSVDGETRSLRVRENSELTVWGSNFNYPLFDPITDLEGTITGTLLDGNRFSWTFEREPAATIILIPEPSAITLSAFGFLGLLGCRRKKNAA